MQRVIPLIIAFTVTSGTSQDDVMPVSFTKNLVLHPNLTGETHPISCFSVTGLMNGRFSSLTEGVNCNTSILPH